MFSYEMSTRIAQEQYLDRVAAAEQHRLVVACCPKIAVSRLAARPIGRALVRLGATLLRYGRVEAPVDTRPYRASVRSIRLN